MGAGERSEAGKDVGARGSRRRRGGRPGKGESRRRSGGSKRMESSSRLGVGSLRSGLTGAIGYHERKVLAIPMQSKQVHRQVCWYSVICTISAHPSWAMRLANDESMKVWKALTIQLARRQVENLHMSLLSTFRRSSLPHLRLGSYLCRLHHLHIVLSKVIIECRGGPMSCDSPVWSAVARNDK